MIESSAQDVMDMHEAPLDLDDPHRAALEDNPARAERPSFKTILAVVVR